MSPTLSTGLATFPFVMVPQLPRLAEHGASSLKRVRTPANAQVSLVAPPWPVQFASKLFIEAVVSRMISASMG